MFLSKLFILLFKRLFLFFEGNDRFNYISDTVTPIFGSILYTGKEIFCVTNGSNDNISIRVIAVSSQHDIIVFGVDSITSMRAIRSLVPILKMRGSSPTLTNPLIIFCIWVLEVFITSRSLLRVFLKCSEYQEFSYFRRH